MKNSKLVSCLIYPLLCLSLSATAQKMKMVSGDLEGLKKELSFDIAFDYDSLTIGHNVPEKKYVADVSARWESKQMGKGKDFEKRWYDSRKTMYEPAFVRNFEESTLKKLNDKTAKYKLIVKTRWIEPGFDFGVHGKEGIIAGDLLIVEAADTTKVKAKINFYDAAGTNNTGGDFNIPSRIKSAYEKAGMWLGIFLKRKAS